MPRAQVRRRLSEELFEVLGHGLLWFNDEGSIIGAADVVESASLTELRRAIDRYRATVDDVEVELLVYDVDEQLLLEDDGVVSPRDVSLELVHNHTFIDLTLTVDPDVRFNKNEVATRSSFLPPLRRQAQFAGTPVESGAPPPTAVAFKGPAP